MVNEMEKYKRIFVIVLDSLGIGAMPDSEKFGDTGVDRIPHHGEDPSGKHLR